VQVNVIALQRLSGTGNISHAENLDLFRTTEQGVDQSKTGVSS
jgi:hypothetical protein